ncbi:DDE-domain-containing protein [Mycena sanguinolenta]|uniref:DDE-domain-containing protein n=1 Tax=Mycena sanguinolenta TaxID=230812 RepID=A0A8H6XPX6_9AGAR|nr:DDE-domain-containing protein [Mycena sanguinolenta]
MYNLPPDIADVDLNLLSVEERMQLAIKTMDKTGMPERPAAKYFRVPRATLQSHRQGVLPRVEAHAHERVVSVVQEQVLVEWIKIVGRRGFPLSLETVGAYASAICGTTVGKSWPERFKARHPDLKVKWTTSLEECRAHALNPVVVNQYFTLLKETIDQYDIQFKNIYNMDEKGIQLGVGDRIKALVDHDQKTVQQIHNGNRDLVTIIECICADGTALHPSVVFEGVRRDLNWGADNPANARNSARFGSKKILPPATAERLDNPADYRLLILDGHNSHGTFRFMQFAEKHRIVVLCLPSHTTHALQPCDVGVFGPLARKWKARVSELARNYIVINKYNLLSNYSVVRDQAFSTANIKAAFRKCGIWPLDESAVDVTLFEPAVNYTTQSAQPLPARLPSLLVPINPTVASSSAVPSSGATADDMSSTTSRTTLQSSAATVSGPFPAPERPSTPPHPNIDAHARNEVYEALYKIAVPSPLRGRPSIKAMAAENAQLRSIAQAAGVELERNHAQMILMDQENARLRKQLHAKKHKRKATYNTGYARLMTGAEIQAELLKELQKKQMAEMHVGLKKLFPGIKKSMVDAQKAKEAEEKEEARKAKAMAKEAEKIAKAAEKEAAKARKKAEREAAKAAKVAEKEAARAARARGRGRGRARSRGAVQGGARSRVQTAEEAWDSGDEADSVHNSPSEDKSDDTDNDANVGGLATGAPSDEEIDIGNEIEDMDESDNEDDDAEETGIDSINGHRWRDNHIEFQVLWTDADVTWEPLSNVNDCAAMDDYLAHRDADDPLLLPKRKYLINKALKATNE